MTRGKAARDGRRSMMAEPRQRRTNGDESSAWAGLRGDVVIGQAQPYRRAHRISAGINWLPFYALR